MGWFDTLCNVGKKVAKAAAVVAGTVAAVVAAPEVAITSALGYSAYKAGQKLGLIDSDDVGKTEALTETSSAAEVEDISDALRRERKKYLKAGEDEENQCKKNVEIYFDYLIGEIRKEEKLSGSFSIEQILKKKLSLCDDIEGTITDALKLNLSLDNAECRDILSLDSGEEKQQKMDNFAMKVIGEAKDELSEKIKTTMNQLTNEITNFLTASLESAEVESESRKSKFDKWEQDMENESFDSERAQLEPRIKIYAIEQVEKILAA